MFLRMYAPELTSDVVLEHGELEKLALVFSNSIPDDKFSPVQLQGSLPGHRRSPVNASSGISDWVKQKLSQA